MCDVIQHGGTRAGIEKHFAAVCGTGERRGKDLAEEALEEAIVALEQSNEQFSEAFTAFEVVNALVTALGLIIGLVLRFARPAARLLPLVRTSLLAREQQIVVQVAANQRAIDIARQAAANEARFRLTGSQ